MACDTWSGKIAAYADAELSAGEMRAIAEHLKSCPSCTTELLSRVQLKRAIQSAGARYEPSLALRERIQKELAEKKKPVRAWNWVPKLVTAAAFMVISAVVLTGWSSYERRQTFAELADLHIATMASATPVDVVSTDRHTVKPWFQGKIPFTFNLPELGDTQFSLDGGRMAYLEQAPGAQLIFKDGNHRISVFIFQEQLGQRFRTSSGSSRRLTFNVESWTGGGLRYFVIGDAEASDLHKLSELLQTAARS